MTGAAQPRVRFAPSPTGDLHIGNARTALFNWLFARHTGGAFILRIEDTDRERTEDVFIANLLEDLRWLSLDWDEGPDRAGACGPYRQSERLDLYREHLARLIDAGWVYPCYCTEAELEAERAALLARRMAPRYLGKCRQLTDAERRRYEREGRCPAYRFRVAEGPVGFTDLIRGEMSFRGEALGDFIVVRSNGIPAYNFACVVDDHLMAISHVIRGEDHLSNTALQCLLYRALGFDPPVFAHHALILGQDRAKLGKRHGAVSVRAFRERGILPQALSNYLAILGSSLTEKQEICTQESLVRDFSLDRTGRGGAVFDEAKLAWLNALYLKRMPLDDLTARILPFLEREGMDVRRLDRRWLMALVEAVRDNWMTLADAPRHLNVFFDERHAWNDEARTVLMDENARRVVRLFRDLLLADLPPDEQVFARSLKALRKQAGVKGRALYLPLRAAVTGATEGPELDRIMAALGWEAVVQRLDRVLRESF
jgi:nondiscriminating glutamyl-tRNA synthetase